MLQVKSCNVNHNSESVFRYFASAVNSNYSTKCNRKDLYAICSYPSFKKVGYVPLYTFRNRCWIYSDWAFEKQVLVRLVVVRFLILFRIVRLFLIF